MTGVLEPIDTQIPTSQAYAFALQHGVEAWFDACVVDPRTRKDRIDANELLKPREADRFQRLQLLIERATQAFDNEDKALHWLTREQSCFQGATPLDYAVWERNFLAVLDHLTRIEYGIYA